MKIIKFILGIAIAFILLYVILRFFNVDTSWISFILEVTLSGIIALAMAIKYSNSKKKHQLWGAIFFLNGAFLLVFKNNLLVKNIMAVILVLVFTIGIYYYFTEKRLNV
ncbi:hypothetical protein [Desulfosporosinus shakirovi]|uniref:hypothetical protein n=1 Tax=Desulfosporosinus shakirovi TaxID=2885154 RepID=UPI001E2F7EC2|nr:hypothetical protein [Desulfosporosinus sp. SRJS8]MCB8815351.1 hypothetical protein [Desulfosporosinus sp. SRJS8]